MCLGQTAVVLAKLFLGYAKQPRRFQNSRGGYVAPESIKEGSNAYSKPEGADRMSEQRGQDPANRIPHLWWGQDSD